LKLGTLSVQWAKSLGKAQAIRITYDWLKGVSTVRKRRIHANDRKQWRQKWKQL
jgi:hypothetical protein